MIAECEELLGDGVDPSLSSGAKVLLRRHVGVMRGVLGEGGGREGLGGRGGGKGELKGGTEKGKWKGKGN